MNNETVDSSMKTTVSGAAKSGEEVMSKHTIKLTAQVKMSGLETPSIIIP